MPKLLLDKIKYHDEIVKCFKKIGLTCKFFANKEITQTNYTLVSSVVFKLKKSYKNSVKYSDGLRKIMNFMKNTKLQIVLRIYYDCSVLSTEPEHKKVNDSVWIPLFKELNDVDNIQLVRYQFNELLNAEKYHEGLFGTIIRLLPMFDFDEFKSTKSVFCVDIEHISGFTKSVNSIPKIKQWKYDVFFGTRLCSHLDARLKYTCFDKYGFDYRITACSLYVNVKIPVEIITSFLSCVQTNCDNYKKWVESTRKTQHNPKISITSHYKWVYGIDEYLVNRFMLINLLERKTKIGLFMLLHTYDKVFYPMQFILDKVSKKSTDMWMNLFNKILGEYYTNNLKNNIKILDDVLYNPGVSKMSKSAHINIEKTFIEEFNKIIKAKQTELYNIPSESAKCFLLNYTHKLKQVYEVKYVKNIVEVLEAKNKTL
jgi:hypothetical protein